MIKGQSMGEVSADQLRSAVEAQHGGRATLRETIPVSEEFGGQPVWQGVVHVFELSGHPAASTAYAWSSTVEGGDRRRFYAVLGVQRSTRRQMRCGRRSWRTTRRPT